MLKEIEVQEMEMLITIGLVIVFALCPPLGTIFFLAILCSGGKIDNLISIIGGLVIFVAMAYAFT